MQLSNPTPTSDLNLAAVLMGGVDVPGAIPAEPGQAPVEPGEPTGFAELFPELGVNGGPDESGAATATAAVIATSTMPVVPVVAHPAQFQRSVPAHGPALPICGPVMDEGEIEVAVCTMPSESVSATATPRGIISSEDTEDVFERGVAPELCATPEPTTTSQALAFEAAAAANVVAPQSLNPRTEQATANVATRGREKHGLLNRAGTPPMAAPATPMDARTSEATATEGAPAKAANATTPEKASVSVKPEPMIPNPPAGAFAHRHSPLGGPNAQVAPRIPDEVMPPSQPGLPLDTETPTGRAELPLPASPVATAARSVAADTANALGAQPRVMADMVRPAISRAVGAQSSVRPDGAVRGEHAPGLVDEENFAENEVGRNGLAFDAISRPTKSFVASLRQQLAASGPTIGIDVANSGGAMLPQPAAPRFDALLHDHVGAAAAGEPAAAESQSLRPEVAEVSTAHRAVEVVLTAAERVASREQQSVQLSFSVGDTELRVRVQLKDNEVHTTFATDSDELRAALSQEWQSVTTTSAERPVRLAPPVFTSNDQPGNGFAGQGDRHAHAQGRAHGESSFSPSLRSGVSTGGQSAGEAPALRSAPSGTARHLHILA